MHGYEERGAYAVCATGFAVYQPERAAEVYQNFCSPQKVGEIMHFIDTGECADETLPEYQAKGAANRPVYAPKGIAGIAKDRAVVLFDFDSSALRPETQPVLSAWGHALRQRPALRLRLLGHTDALGEATYNQSLSLQRAGAVAAFLQTHFALPAARFQLEGLGETQPLYADCSQSDELSCRANRRVEFVLH